MTGGRTPAAPGGDSGADPGLADLGAINGCDALLDLVAGRRLDPPLARRDPALAVLSARAADVDSTGPARRSTGPRSTAARPAAAWRPRQATVAALVASALATLILAVMVAGTTGLLAASTLARLSWPGRGPGPGRR